MSERMKFTIVIASVFILIGFWRWNVIALSGKQEKKKNACELYVLGLNEYRNNRLEKAEDYLLESFHLKRHSLVAYLLTLIYANNKDSKLSIRYALEALQADPQLNQKYRKTAVDILFWSVVSIKSPGRFSPVLSNDDKKREIDVFNMAAKKEKKKSEQQTEIPEEVYKYVSKNDVEWRIKSAHKYKRIETPEQLREYLREHLREPMDKIKFESPNTEFWPYKEFAYAKAYLYNLENKLRGNHAIIKQNKLEPTIVGEGVPLTTQQAETVAALSNLYIGGLNEGLSKSYIPHHCIVFYNRDNKPVAYITFCFDCEAFRIFPHILFKKTSRPLSDQERKELLEIMGQYKRIILQLKLPVFNSPFDYQENRTLKGQKH